MPEQAQASSSLRMHSSSRLMPGPPYCSGILTLSKPAASAFLTIGQANSHGGLVLGDGFDFVFGEIVRQVAQHFLF